MLMVGEFLIHTDEGDMHMVKRQINLASDLFSAGATHLLVSVCGGGHNIPRSCVCNGGRVTDLTRMKSVRKV